MNVQKFPSRSRYASSIGFSAAVVAGGFVFVSGITAVSPDGEVVGVDDAAVQTREILRKIGAALSEAGSDLSKVVQTRIYLTRAQDWEAVGRAHGESFADVLPAATMVVVAGLLDPRMMVEIEAVAVLPEPRLGTVSHER